MKKLLKVACLSLFITSFGTSLFAQNLTSQINNTTDLGNIFTSNTNCITSTMFKTDVDDMLNVKTWSNLAGNLNNFLLTSCFGGQDINLGLGKKLNNNYLALYYRGTLWNGLSASFFENETSDGSNMQNNTKNNFSLLYGVNNFGIKLSVNFNDYSTKTYDSDTKIQIKDIIKTLDANLSMAMKKETEKSIVSPYFAFDYNSNVKKNTIDNDGKKSFTDESVRMLKFMFGTEVCNKSETKVSNSFDIPFYFNLELYPSKSSEQEELKTFAKENRSLFTIAAKPSYKINYKPIEKLSVGAKFALPIAFSLQKIGDTVITVDGNSSSIKNDISNMNIEVLPNVGLGLQYSFIPDVLKLNFGMEYNLPMISIFRDKNGIAKTVNKGIKGSSDYEYLIVRLGLSYNLNNVLLIDTSISGLLNNDYNSLYISNPFGTYGQYFYLGLSLKL